MPWTHVKFANTRHEIRLAFSESADSLLARLGELSETRLSVGRGLLPRSTVRLSEGKLRVSQFGRTLLRGQVEPHSQGCSLILTTSAPLLKTGVFLWLFTAVHGAYYLLQLIVVDGTLDGEGIAGSFLVASFIGTLVFPSLWGRRWEFHRIAGALSERLNAENDSDIQSRRHEANLSRRGAWTSSLSAFLWSPLLAINGYPVPLSGRQPSVAPWVNAEAFLSDSVSVEGAVLFWFLFLGWVFVGSGAVCGHLVATLLPREQQRSCRWTTTGIAMGASLGLSWLISGSKTLERLFYLP